MWGDVFFQSLCSSLPPSVAKNVVVFFVPPPHDREERLLANRSLTRRAAREARANDSL